MGSGDEVLSTAPARRVDKTTGNVAGHSGEVEVKDFLVALRHALHGTGHYAEVTVGTRPTKTGTVATIQKIQSTRDPRDIQNVNFGVEHSAEIYIMTDGVGWEEFLDNVLATQQAIGEIDGEIYVSKREVAFGDEGHEAVLRVQSEGNE